MLEVPIEGSRAQIGSHPLRVAQQSESVATAARAAVAYCERMGDKTESIFLERAAQREQDRIDIAAGLAVCGDVGEQY